MTTPLLIAYAFLSVTLLKPLLVRAQVIHASCARCGKPYERRELGQPICNCLS